MSKTKTTETIEQNVQLPGRIYHAYNRKPLARDFEHVEGVSMTIPDHTMSIREIFSRYASGRGINASIKEPIFHGDDAVLPDLKRLDLVEIGQLLENTRENRALLESQLKQEQDIIRNLEIEEQAKRKKEEDERLLKLYQERQSQLNVK